ncbi:MAG: phytoene desaturase family protein [Myxococcaceae bacterium]
MSALDAAVIGSGPNGLAAAIVLAKAGLKVRVHEAQATVGGGMRSEELTLPGFVHDVCSAIHPLGAGSPFFNALPLGEHGLEWIHPEVAVAHPLDDGSAGVLLRSMDETVRALEVDGESYRQLIAPLSDRFTDLLEDLLRPVPRMPRHPLLFARFGLHAAMSSAMLARGFDRPRTRALIAGLAAHAILPLTAPFTATFALMFGAATHASGWPLAKGGSQSIANALSSVLRSHSGELVVGARVDALEQPGHAKAYLFDTSPATLDRIAGAKLPTRYRARLQKFRHGPGIFKIDYALSAPVPWSAEACRRAGTVHVGGTFEEIAEAEAQVARGEHPKRPFVLVTQQSLFDPTRAPPGKHTLWAYCHVPNGSTVDMTAQLEAQLERFAPGFKDVVLARAVSTTRDIEAHNENYRGGDIGGGGNDGTQLFARPVIAVDPYATPTRELYLCSASTPPGAGVHGMCGVNAALSALKRSFGMKAPAL